MNHKVPSASDEWRKTPGKKDTKTWCKGKVGRPHEPVVALSKWGYYGECRIPPEWSLKLRPEKKWLCFHEIVCGICGKFLKYIDPKDCPLRPDVLG